MKVHILTGHFYPQIHPRAFRSNELAIEFAKRGYDVTVTNLSTTAGFDYEEYGRANGIKILNMGLSTNTPTSDTVKPFKRSFVGRTLAFLRNYLMAGSLLFTSKTIRDRLQIDEDTDLIIALSTPFKCILGLSYYLRKKKSMKMVAIADSGDPFYYSKQYKRAPWFASIEKKAYQQYDYLTIPVESAIPSYNKLISVEKIKIIPQGFRMDNVKLYKGELPAVTNFAYAGVFYWDIRNPEFLFKYLNSLDLDFKFHIYMRFPDSILEEMLNQYSNLKQKVEVHFSVPREQLLYELSMMHFLVNINNKSNTQIPSKIIDYGITGRPIFSCNKETFTPSKLDSFMSGNYTDKMEFDISKYDIVNIVNEFMSLYQEKR